MPPKFRQARASRPSTDSTVGVVQDVVSTVNGVTVSLQNVIDVGGGTAVVQRIADAALSSVAGLAGAGV